MQDSHHISLNRRLNIEIHSRIFSDFQLSKPKTIYLEEFYVDDDGNDDGGNVMVE